VTWEVRSLADFAPVPEPEEDGHTFEINARTKALYYAGSLDALCVAEDSGLVVDALDGAPGVQSARYAGNGHDSTANNAKLLEALAGVPELDRTARFVCCAALAEPGRILHVETGSVEGRIAFACAGSSGFGYDPLFIPEGYSETFAELGPDVKQQISHRARAFAKICAHLRSMA
jgi:XTP/dITP diphosphohydrolase